MTLNPIQRAAAEELAKREIRRSLAAWYRFNGLVPAAHHSLLVSKLEDVVSGKIRNLIVCEPPGSAKSTVISYLFPTWFLQCAQWNAYLEGYGATPHVRTILACSYAKDMIQGWGRRCRNLVGEKAAILGYDLRPDSQAADEWETTNNGRYFCAGVGAGIAGHRADIGFIDDPIGAEDDADSQTFRDKQWNWFWNDFNPRIFPWGARIIIANRRNEDDLVGRILETDGQNWHTVILPFFAEENDPLGRPAAPLSVDISVVRDRTKTDEDLLKEPALQPFINSRLWPEFYTPLKAIEVLKAPARTRAGLWQQAPAVSGGNLFTAEMFVPYEPDQLPKNLRIYVASDHAVSEEHEKNGDSHCLLPLGVDESDEWWLLPDIWWKRANTEEAVEAMLALAARRKPIIWWGEAENIFKSFYPFLRKRMMETGTYINLEKLTPSKKKEVRAQSIVARLANRPLHVPKYSHWWPLAERQLLAFPAGKHDDLVDPLAYLGLGLERIVSAHRPKPKPAPPKTLTLAWVKDCAKRVKRAQQLLVLNG